MFSDETGGQQQSFIEVEWLVVAEIFTDTAVNSCLLPQKDDFNSFIPATITIYSGLNPT